MNELSEDELAAIEAEYQQAVDYGSLLKHGDAARHIPRLVAALRETRQSWAVEKDALLEELRCARAAAELCEMMLTRDTERAVRRNQENAELQERVAELEAEREALPLLVKVAAREQRYACVDVLNERFPDAPGSASVQNTRCPDPERVLELWRKQSQTDNRDTPTNCDSPA